MSLRNYKKLVSLSAPAITTLGLHRLFDKKYSGKGHILMFHRVLPKTERLRVHNHESLEIDPYHLEQTILFFKKRNFQFISIDELPEYLIENSSRKFVIFTLDDGYKDNLLHAYPVFKKYAVPFTIYITNNFINGTAVMWWYLLEEVLLNNEQISFNWQGKHFEFHCSTLSQKESAFEDLRKMIVTELTPDRHLEQLGEIFGKYIGDLYSYTKEHALSWKEVRKLSEDPLTTIGAHTANHFPLRQLSSDELEDEICRSREELKKQLKREIHHFAYPFGKKMEAGIKEFEFVKHQGFKTAVTTNIGNVFSEHIDHLHKLPRVNINALTTSDVLELHISGVVPFLKNGINHLTF